MTHGKRRCSSGRSTFACVTSMWKLPIRVSRGALPVGLRRRPRAPACHGKGDLDGVGPSCSDSARKLTAARFGSARAYQVETIGTPPHPRVPRAQPRTAARRCHQPRQPPAQGQSATARMPLSARIARATGSGAPCDSIAGCSSRHSPAPIAAKLTEARCHRGGVSSRHGNACVDGDVFAALRLRRADVRCENHVWRPAERVVRRGGL